MLVTAGPGASPITADAATNTSQTWKSITAGSLSRKSYSSRAQIFLHTDARVARTRDEPSSASEVENMSNKRMMPKNHRSIARRYPQFMAALDALGEAAAGASAEEVQHAVIAATSTIGFPNAMAALSWISDVTGKARA